MSVHSFSVENHTIYEKQTKERLHCQKSHIVWSFSESAHNWSCVDVVTEWCWQAQIRSHSFDISFVSESKCNVSRNLCTRFTMMPMHAKKKRKEKRKGNNTEANPTFWSEGPNLKITPPYAHLLESVNCLFVFRLWKKSWNGRAADCSLLCVPRCGSCRWYMWDPSWRPISWTFRLVPLYINSRIQLLLEILLVLLWALLLLSSSLSWSLTAPDLSYPNPKLPPLSFQFNVLLMSWPHDAGTVLTLTNTLFDLGACSKLHVHPHSRCHFRRRKNIKVLCINKSCQFFSAVRMSSRLHVDPLSRCHFRRGYMKLLCIDKCLKGRERDQTNTKSETRMGTDITGAATAKDDEWQTDTAMPVACKNGKEMVTLQIEDKK